MFGWFKRKPKPLTLAASWDHELPKYAMVGIIIGHPTRVSLSDKREASDLVWKISEAKQHKKKHSHLLAELKALEVKE